MAKEDIMARRGRRKPPSLRLLLRVEHPASNVDAYAGASPTAARQLEQEDEARADADGHIIHYGMDEFRGGDLADVTFQRGIDSRTAASILRKLASLVESHPELLSARQGCMGEVVDGTLEDSAIQLQYDDMGNVVRQEIMSADDEA